MFDFVLLYILYGTFVQKEMPLLESLNRRRLILRMKIFDYYVLLSQAKTNTLYKNA